MGQRARANRAHPLLIEVESTMIPLVKSINGLLTSLFGLLVWPFQGSDPLWPILFVSLLTGILMLWIFGKVSNQDAIRRIKNNIRGNLFGVRLFQHDVGIVLRLQGRIFRDTFTYLRYSTIPMLVLIVPVMLIIVQLNLHFSLRPLQPGGPTVLVVRLTEPSVLEEEILLQTPAGVRVETPAVRIESQNEISWRIRAEQPGQYPLTVQVGEEAIEKELSVGQGWRAVSALRTNSLLGLLLYPGEAPIPSSHTVESIEVKYRPLQISIWGWKVHWLVLFFLLSIFFGFAFKGALGVEL